MKDASDEYHVRKHDADKPRPALIPGSVLLEVGKVLTYGAKKYAAHSWQTIPDAKERYLDAMIRHYCAMVDGETHDAESGLLHAAHMACNAVFLCWFAIREAACEHGTKERRSRGDIGGHQTEPRQPNGSSEVSRYEEVYLIEKVKEIVSCGAPPDRK